MPGLKLGGISSATAAATDSGANENTTSGGMKPPGLAIGGPAAAGNKPKLGFLDLRKAQQL